MDGVRVQKPSTDLQAPSADPRVPASDRFRDPASKPEGKLRSDAADDAPWSSGGWDTVPPKPFKAAVLPPTPLYRTEVIGVPLWAYGMFLAVFLIIWLVRKRLPGRRAPRGTSAPRLGSPAVATAEKPPPRQHDFIDG